MSNLTEKSMTFYKVEVIESERGWGQKVDDTYYYATKEQADAKVKSVNAENTLPSAPDVYWRANAPTTIILPSDLLELVVEEFKARRKS